MFGWFYGRQRKIEYEVAHKISISRLNILLSDPGVQRVPGLCFFYMNIEDGLTPILGHYVMHTRSLHKITVFVTLCYLLVTKVSPHERIAVKKLGLKGIYRCVIHYGYADNLKLEGDSFVSQVTASIRAHMLDSSENEQEIFDLEKVTPGEVVHIYGKSRFCPGKKCRWFDRMMLGFYQVLHTNCRSALPAMGVPLAQRIEVGMLYEA